MQLLYLAAFAAGLAISVYVMIRGVERIARQADSPELDSLGRTVGTARMALTAPIVGAFAGAFGITGYLLWRYSGLSSGGQFVGAAVAGILASVVGARAVTKWATQAAEHDVVDERYMLQCQPAQVVAPISPLKPGKNA
jgi:hypothetical protein